MGAHVRRAVYSRYRKSRFRAQRSGKIMGSCSRTRLFCHGCGLAKGWRWIWASFLILLYDDDVRGIVVAFGISCLFRNGGEILARVQQTLSRRVPARAATFGRPSMRRPAGVKLDFVFLLFFLFASLAEAFVARRFGQERAGFARRSALLTGSPRHGLITQRSKEKRSFTRTPHRFSFHTHSQCEL